MRQARKGKRRPVTSAGFWRAYWTTLRPYLFFVSGASGLVGFALVPSVHGAALWVGAVAFFLTYGLGQALTDVTQTDTDAWSSPYRPLVRGEIGRGAVASVSLAGLVLCALVFASMNPWTLLPAAVAVVGLATYTPFKRRWWGGPAWNSWIISLLPLIGWLCAGGTPVGALRDRRLLPAMASIFFSYAIFVLLGYLKDVEADRATGYRTLPVRFGRRPSIVARAALLGAAIASSGWLLVRAEVGPPVELSSVTGWVLWLVGICLLSLAHIRMWPVRDDAGAYPALEWVVLGYVAMHLGESTLLRPAFALPSVAILAGARIALALRPSRAQV